MSNMGTNIRNRKLNEVEELIVKEKDTPVSAKSEVS